MIEQRQLGDKSLSLWKTWQNSVENVSLPVENLPNFWGKVERGAIYRQDRIRTFFRTASQDELYSAFHLALQGF